MTLEQKLIKTSHLLGLCYGGFRSLIEQLKEPSPTIVLQDYIKLLDKVTRGINESFYNEVEPDSEIKAVSTRIMEKYKGALDGLK